MKRNFALWKNIHLINVKNDKETITALLKDNLLITNITCSISLPHYLIRTTTKNLCVLNKRQKPHHWIPATETTKTTTSIISLKELDHHIHYCTWDSSPDPEHIHPVMLKHLHSSAKLYLLHILDRLLIQILKKKKNQK